jgi:hypothetical protein
VIVVHDNEKREWKTAGEDESKKKYGSPQPLPPSTPASSTTRHIFFTGMRSQPCLFWPLAAERTQSLGYLASLLIMQGKCL